MNRETQKTLIFVCVALLLSGAAFITIPDRTGLHNTFDDQGKKFFPELTDPNACTSLEVIEFDPSTLTALPFKVTFKNGKWTIPSHHDYPADARDRLSKTAGAVIDLKKDSIRSDRVEDHETLGVVDPLDLKSSSLKGQGKRITLRDATERVLADFIIGKEVKDHPGQRYVRDPRYNRTYAVKVAADLTTKFGDWIESNLLKLDPSRIRRITWDKTKVDPDQRRVIPGETLVIERKDATSPWVVPGLSVPVGKEIDTTKINELIQTLSTLKIVGVRTKPPGLTRDLKLGGEAEIQITQQALASLRSKGFYPTNDKRILSNEGDMRVETEDGAVYTLRFGEVYFATGETLSAGEGEDDSKSPESLKRPAPDKKAKADEESRFVLVTVAFSPDLVPPLPESVGASLELPKDVFLRKPGTPEYEAQQKEINEARAKRASARSEQLATKEKPIKELSDRFADWYYVTPGSSFRGLGMTMAELIHDKPAESPGRPNLGGRPGFGGELGGQGFPGLPGGHP